jgi:hypothetical protein
MTSKGGVTFNRNAESFRKPDKTSGSIRPTPTAQNRRFEFSSLGAESRTIGSVRGFQL